MSTQVVIDPWDQAMNPPVSTYKHYGKVWVEAWLAVLVKGQGKVPYIEGSVMPDGKEAKPVTAIKISITPIPEEGYQWGEVLREFVALGNSDWANITLPSLRDAGILNLQELSGKYAVVELVPNGQHSTNKTSGKEVNYTTFKFLAVFDTEQLCREAYLKEHPQNGNGAKAATPAPAQTTVAPPANSNERETALKFLPTYVKKAVAGAGGDLDKAREALAILIAGQGLLKKYFTIDSPEVVDLMMAEMAK